MSFTIADIASEMRLSGVEYVEIANGAVTVMKLMSDKTYMEKVPSGTIIRKTLLEDGTYKLNLEMPVVSAVAGDKGDKNAGAEAFGTGAALRIKEGV